MVALEGTRGLDREESGVVVCGCGSKGGGGVMREGALGYCFPSMLSDLCFFCQRQRQRNLTSYKTCYIAESVTNLACERVQHTNVWISIEDLVVIFLSVHQLQLVDTLLSLDRTRG